MNRKQLGILIVLLIVLGGVGLVLHRNQASSWTTGGLTAGGKLLENFPVNEVAWISISQGTNSLNLIKKGDLWCVSERADYPANFSQISELLLKVRDLKIIQNEEVGPSQLARVQLAPPGQGTNSALTVEFKGQDGRMIKTLLLGKLHLKKSPRPSQFGERDMDWPDGRFVKVSDSKSVAVISDPLETVEPRPEGWLNRNFIHVENVRSIGVTFPQTTNSWKLTRETGSGDWKLTEARPGEHLDPARTAEISNPLASPSFTDVVGRAAESTRPIVVDLSTFDGFQYRLNVAQKIDEDYPVTLTVTAEIPKERTAGKGEKPEDKIKLDQEFKDRQQKLENKLKQEQSFAEWTYRVASWVMDPVLKERGQLLAENKPEQKDKPSADSSSATGSKATTPGIPAGTEN